ncbi:PAAR domain-containing protein [Massilia cellulosiltytica]|uniref:PAAR domain-containing protein n=1 Tax=Massilia cellulosiltytica TaxID=2683234 RepID=UPI0039B381BA
MPAAARLGDPIGHSPTMSWLLKGLLIGAAIAVAGVAIVGTGGLAAVAVVGAGAAMGAGLGEAMSTMSFAAKEVTGAIAMTGSSNVFVNNLAAARAHVDMVACSKHPGPIPIATGSGQVYINGMPAARVDDKTGCSAVITKGSNNVYIGGGTAQTDTINPENLVPGWVHASLLVVGVGSAIVLAGPVIAVGGLVGAFAGGIGGGWVGGKMFGEGSDGQKWSAIAGSFLGGYLGAKAAPGAWEFAQRVQVSVEPGTLGMNGGNVRVSLRPPATAAEPPARVSASTYARLRAKTPSSAIQKQVNEGVTLPMPDRALPGLTVTKPLHADHIVSMKQITEMEGFARLSQEDQLAVLNNPRNFIGLSETANTSKGAKSFADWTEYKKGGIAVDPAFRQEMMQKEVDMAAELQQQIYNLLGGG